MSRNNFGSEHLVECDICNVDGNDIPDFDVLLAGFPCQAFSVAGKRLGFETEKKGRKMSNLSRRHHRRHTKGRRCDLSPLHLTPTK